MELRTELNLTEEIFNQPGLITVGRTVVLESAEEFKTYLKQNIINSKPSGRTYNRRGRIHQASARGQRPAIDTGTLLNSINATLISNTEAEISVTAQDRGFSYPGFLQDELNRPTINANDQVKAQQILDRKFANKITSLER